MPRSGSQSHSRGSENEEHFIWVSGLPPNWTWQHLKDYVRGSIVNQPKWTEVIEARPGLREGYFRVVGRKDADLAYNRFADPGVNANIMLVHEWELSRDGAQPNLVRCNCSSRHREMQPGSHSPRRSGIDLNVITRTMMSTTAMNIPVTSAPMAVSYVYPAAPAGYYTAYTTQTAQYGYAAPTAPVTGVPRHAMMPQTPAYSITPNGLPVNISNGVVRTEFRGIFITGLSFSCSEADLRALLRSYGVTPTHSVLPRDQATGKLKGCATVQFASAAEAQDAVKKLDKAQHMGKTITVRHDKDATSVGQPQGPVIANGSTGYIMGGGTGSIWHRGHRW
ncbi:uncharacterized protein BDZ99DRAFT_567268 [Mytilinidion resinicola]|uniref:RRM domain-containing protein n=1 Tax=Mytilinidion resinicola TaxID=574789 RepID=A0A6A6Z446_9PEZI|nr:uncharacterized protein BDZ99DRAFT_567268 [Mytilinidion resinicola]KAF2815423.1 hypothetical protein BDZ99DRAFT_567268 [Mytilinidion resinicola]